MLAALAVLVTAGSLVVGTGAAGANGGSPPIPQGRSAAVRGSDWHARCQFSVASVNKNTLQVNANIGAASNTTSNSGQANNVYSEVDCSLYDSGGNFLDSARFTANGPAVPQQKVRRVEPYSSSYEICVFSFVKQRNGDTLGPLVNCDGP
jgi:hypothetical protein